MPCIHYAVGDVHGRDDLLKDLHERIVAFHGDHFAGQPATVVHIGDYIDRGADSIGVLDRLMIGIRGFRMVCLKGNHEDMMLRCLQTDDDLSWEHWLRNGAGETLASLGLSPDTDFPRPVQLERALGEHRIAWLRSLPVYYRWAHCLFVHAGIVPGMPVEHQKESDLLWIRDRFLYDETDHGFLVVHGHTAGERPVVRANRLCVDTGVIATGVLTAAVLAPGIEPSFLEAIGDPGAGPNPAGFS